MPLSLRTKQIAGVTALVGLVTILLSLWYLSSLASIQIRESQARAELLSSAIYQRIVGYVAAGNDPYTLQMDGGLQSILQASLYDDAVLYAAVVEPDGKILAFWDAANVGQTLSAAEDLGELVNAGPFAQARAIYETRTYEHRQPLLLGDKDFGSIRIGVSTLLVRTEIRQRMTTPLITAVTALIVSTVFAVLLAQAVVKPIHVIRSGLARLGRGELNVSVDLPADEELAELGDSFKAISARLAADRTELAGQRATLASVAEHLEDAVALFSPDGQLLFANPAMSAVLGGTTGTVAELLPAGHPYRIAIEDALAGNTALTPRTVHVQGAGERLVIPQVVADADGTRMGVLLVARNLAYLSEVESTLSYSRKLAALGRLSAGIAHEVKNPLNAVMIHLELLRMQVEGSSQAMEHVNVIGAQMRRLDEVVQGFLKFTRPEDLKLRPAAIANLVEEVLPVIRAEASNYNVDVIIEIPHDLPLVNADEGMLAQAFLNLGINACQAMPNGGRLRIAAVARPDRQVEVRFEDSGIGIEPADLARIFDLYFTTKTHGSGIGLSLVYRTVQLHDGDIEVQSAPGQGTTFKIVLRQAVESPARRLVPAS